MMDTMIDSCWPMAIDSDRWCKCWQLPISGAASAAARPTAILHRCTEKDRGDVFGNSEDWRGQTVWMKWTVHFFLHNEYGNHGPRLLISPEWMVSMGLMINSMGPVVITPFYTHPEMSNTVWHVGVHLRVNCGRMWSTRATGTVSALEWPSEALNILPSNATRWIVAIHWGFVQRGLDGLTINWNGYGSIPINTIFRGMNIHLPAILMFTRGTRFWHTAKCSILISNFINPRNGSSYCRGPALTTTTKAMSDTSTRCILSWRKASSPKKRTPPWQTSATRGSHSVIQWHPVGSLSQEIRVWQRNFGISKFATILL